MQWSTTSQPAANAARLRSAIVPDSAFIETSSLISRPWNPINPRITSRTIVTEVVAGATGSMAENTTCAVMPSGRPAERPEGGKIGRFQGGPVGIDHRQAGVAVGAGAAMTGQVLEHRQDAAGQQALRDRAGDGRDLCRLGSIGAVADHRVAAGDRNVGQRKAVDVDPKNTEVCRDQVTAEPSSGQARGHVAVVERAIAGAGRIGRPMRRPEPLHPAAFLVHQDGRFPANGVAK